VSSYRNQEKINCLFSLQFFGLVDAHIHFSYCRKRTKKSAVKPGRKNSKTAEIPPPGQATSRTRAAVAREAALRARLEVEQAEIKAREAQEVAEEASRALTVLQTEPTPLQI
jgi:hypothetical protein